MARPLSKRQRKEVHSIVRSAISPEWKLCEGKSVIHSFDEESEGSGTDITATVIQGVGASNRIGNQIRVKRLDLWASVFKAQCPAVASPHPSAALLYRAETGASYHPTIMKDLFDTALYNRYLQGPSPKIRDNAAQGCHIKWMKRFRTRGCPNVYSNAGLFKSAPTTPVVAGVADSVRQHNYTGTIGADAVAMTELVHDVDVHVPHTKDSDVGFDFISFHKAFTFGGAGLKVQYEDAGLVGTVDENHLFLVFAASNAGTEAASDPTKCPRVQFSYRLWYTDD